MAISDVNFSEGEGQDFILELPAVVHAGALDDILSDAGSQQIVSEIPADEGGGGNIFIMSE